MSNPDKKNNLPALVPKQPEPEEDIIEKLQRLASEQTPESTAGSKIFSATPSPIDEKPIV